MEVITEAKYIRISPKKVRTISGQLKSMPVTVALEKVRFMNKKSSVALTKALKLALADAIHNFKLTESGLTIKSVEVNGGPSLKRFTARSRGMGHPILKRSSHIRIILTDEVKETKMQKSETKTENVKAEENSVVNNETEKGGKQ